MNDKGIKKNKNKYQLGNECMICMNKLMRNAKYGCIQTTLKQAQVSMQNHDMDKVRKLAQTNFYDKKDVMMHE